MKASHGIPSTPRAARTVAAGLAMLLFAVALSACSTGTYRVTAIFDDIGDLQSRGSVQVADVRVGRISHIELTSDFKAKVTMNVDKTVRIPESSKALIRTTSLLGEKFVDLRAVGDPAKPPFIGDSYVYTAERTGQAPELEFIAEEAVHVLGGVAGDDIATLVQTGAQAFAGRAADLKSLIVNLNSISANLNTHTTDLIKVLDGLNAAAGTLAAGSTDIQTLLSNLATTTQVLADNRQKAIDAIGQLSRLARSQNAVLDKYLADYDRQVKQVDAILQQVVASKAEVAELLTWLDRFTAGLPNLIQNDFTQVFGWFVPCSQDQRIPAGGCPK